jgi:hypothetical protein
MDQIDASTGIHAYNNLIHQHSTVQSITLKVRTLEASGVHMWIISSMDNPRVGDKTKGVMWALPFG